MAGIFEMLFELFMTIWQNVEGLIMPLISIISEYAPKIVSWLIEILEFILNSLSVIIGAIQKLFKFLPNGNILDYIGSWFWFR